MSTITFAPDSVPTSPSDAAATAAPGPAPVTPPNLTTITPSSRNSIGNQASTKEQPAASCVARLFAATPLPPIKQPASIDISLDLANIVFLITEVQRMPELDVLPVKKCELWFHLLPGLLLRSSKQRIVCPMIRVRNTIAMRVQLLDVAHENENSYCGISMFARVIGAPDYRDLISDAIEAYLPYSLVEELFPEQVADIKITDDMLPHLPAESVTSEEAAKSSVRLLPRKPLTPEQDAELREKVPIHVRFHLPIGQPYPKLRQGEVVRISLSNYASGGLAPNGQPLLVNSLSHLTRVHVAPDGFSPSADDYYRLRGTSSDYPITCDLPEKYDEGNLALTDPDAVVIAAHRIGA